MKLEKFHILQRHAAAQRNRRAIARQRMGIARNRPAAPPAAGGEETGFAMKNVKLARAQLNRDDAGECPVNDDHVDDLKLVKELDFVLDALLIQRLQNHVPGAVGGMTGAPDQFLAEVARVPAEAPLADALFGSAVEGQAHVLQLDHGVDGVFRQDLRRRLIRQIVAAFYRVIGVVDRTVLVQIPERRADAPLRRAGMAARGVELAHYGNIGAAFAGIERRHQTGPRRRQ